MSNLLPEGASGCGTPREACVPGVTCLCVRARDMCIGSQSSLVGRPSPVPAQGLLALLPALAILSIGWVAFRFEE